MKTLSRSSFAAMLALLVAAMVLTRFKHFGDIAHLPDASMAIFFLGGLWLRRHLAFIGLALLAFAIDEASVHYLGVSDFCMTAAYAFMPLAYAALWYAGRAFAPHLRETPAGYAGAFGVALLASVVSFGISNGAFYWLGGRYAEPHVAEYLARLAQWAPLFVRVTMSYVAVALVAQAALGWARHRRGAGHIAS